MQFGICMGTADNITEMMNKGLVDIGLFLGPISTEELAYIRLQKRSYHKRRSVGFTVDPAKRANVQRELVGKRIQ